MKMSEKHGPNIVCIPALLEILKGKDPLSLTHSSKVQRYINLLIPGLIAENIIEEEDIPKLWVSAIIHDFGKIFILKEILTARRKLTSEEYNLVKNHPMHGYNILKQLSISEEPLMAARSHHERWDGRTDCKFPGYPDGLKKWEISLYARIICVCDSYDAMTGDRHYKKPVLPETALKVIENEAGKQFDPVISEIFIKAINNN